MTKAEFLADPHVCALSAWVADRFASSTPWQHAYTNRASGAQWSCLSLVDAFRQYAWNEKPWLDNAAELADYRTRLRAAVESRDGEVVFTTCAAILRWGGVWANNGRTLADRQHLFIDELQHMRAVLTAAETPAPTALRLNPRDPDTIVCAMNAGFVKIYSLLLDDCVIYDGRVGAALGLLARQYCEASGLDALPSALAFAYGVPKESPTAMHPKRRDPSQGPFRFPRLRQDARFHTAQTMRANWFLRATLDRQPGSFSAGELGFHELAAGLFMVGYDLSAA